MGDSLVTMETDKVVTAIPSPRDGVIAAKFGKVGETIHVGSALVEIDIAGVEGEAAVEEAAKTEAVNEEGAGVVGTLEVAGNNAVLSASKEGVETSSATLSRSQKVLATPVARALAKDSGLDINNVKGTGPAGRVTKDDILRELSDSSKSKISSKNSPVNDKAVLTEPLVEIEPLSQIRKTIAKNMIQSKHNAAHMTVFEEVEISELDKVRKRYKEVYSQSGVKLTYLAFIIKATALSLKKFRALNAEMDMERGNMIYKKYYNISKFYKILR